MKYAGSLTLLQLLQHTTQNKISNPDSVRDEQSKSHIVLSDPSTDVSKSLVSTTRMFHCAHGERRAPQPLDEPQTSI